MVTTDTPPRPLIQFRSTLLERRIGEYASLWGLTPNETAKRLTALAATHLDADNYDLVASLSQALSGQSSRLNFVGACEQVRVAVDGANVVREQMGMKPLEGKERANFIESTVQRMANKQRHVQKGTQP